MNQIMCSTFNQRLYEIYAHELIQTWHETSQLLDMHIFCEDGFIGPQVKNLAGAKLYWHDLFDLEPDCKAFVERNKHRDSKGKFYLDGVRFSYKVFAQNAARKFGDRVFYIDSDTKFCKQIQLEHYDRILPKDKFIALKSTAHVATATSEALHQVYVTHNGTEIFTSSSEYLSIVNGLGENDANPPLGIGTFHAKFVGNNFVLQFIPDNASGITTVRSLNEVFY